MGKDVPYSVACAWPCDGQLNIFDVTALIGRLLIGEPIQNEDVKRAADVEGVSNVSDVSELTDMLQ